jgi:hypothetical protein
MYSPRRVIRMIIIPPSVFIFSVKFQAHVFRGTRRVLAAKGSIEIVVLVATDAESNSEFI